MDETLIFFGKDLHFTFYNIQWYDSSVGKTATENTTDHTFKVVKAIVYMRMYFTGYWITNTRIPLFSRMRRRGGRKGKKRRKEGKEKKKK